MVPGTTITPARQQNIGSNQKYHTISEMPIDSENIGGDSAQQNAAQLRRRI
jgi:hypothetical protein